jgi:hypothetical protein
MVMIETVEGLMIVMVYFVGMEKSRRSDSVGIAVLYGQFYVKTALQSPSASALDSSVNLEFRFEAKSSKLVEILGQPWRFLGLKLLINSSSSLKHSSLDLDVFFQLSSINKSLFI